MARKSLVPYALDFDGTDDYVRTVNNPITAAQLATGFTMEGWVNFDTFDATEQSIFDIEGRCRVTLLPTTSKVQFLWNATTGGNKIIADTVAVQTGVWYHIAATWDTTNLTLYKNGVSVGTPETGDIFTLDIVTRPFALGALALDPVNTQFLDGQMAQVRIWNKALNVADLLIHAANARDITSVNTASCTYATNCLIHYPMDQENGTGTTLISKGALSRNGTFKAAGEPAWSANPIIPASRPAASTRTTASTRTVASARNPVV